MRVLLTLLSIALGGGCSLLLNESENNGGSDAGPPDSMGIAAPDICDRSECGVLEVAFEVGPNLDFNTVSSWVAARAGDLVNREVIAIANPPDDDFEADTTLTVEGCFGGRVVGKALRVDGFMYVSLDEVVATAPCALGTPLVENSSALYAGHVGVGTLEKALVDGEIFEENIVIPSSNTSPESFMWLTARPGSEHNGVPRGGAVLVGVNSGQSILDIQAAFTRVEWLEIDGWLGGTQEGISIRASNVEIHRVMIRDDIGVDGSAPAIRVRGLPEGLLTATISNTVIREIDGPCILVSDDNVELTVVNVTAAGCWQNETAPEIAAIELDTGVVGSKLDVVNVISVAHGGSTPSFGTEVTSPVVELTCFHDIPAATNLLYSSSETAVSLVESFPDNLTLANGSPAMMAGIPVGGAQFEESIDAFRRMGSDLWDSGAYED